MDSPPHITGLQAPSEPSVSPVGRRPLSMEWITDDLLQATLAAWSPRYERPLNADDAVEILMNVKRFSEALLRIRKDKA